MPKQVIVIMQDNYPFGQCQECTNQNTRVLVRKIYHLNTPERVRLLERVNVLRKLRNQHMIKIESVLEEEQSIHFLFQYIPIKLETWISNINDQFIENFRDQLIKFSSFLANNFIKIEFQLKNIGMDQNYGAKYFLDLDFEVDTGVNREKLKSNYIREITNLFRPYIMNAGGPVQDERERYSNEYKGREGKNSTDRKIPDSSISPPTNKPNNSKNKEKALAQYYQEVNMSVDSQNQKILQEFMDVLDNEEEEEVKMHTPAKGPLQAPQQQSNQFQKPQTQQQQPQQSSPVQLKNSLQDYQQPKNLYQQNSSNKQNNYPQNNYQQYQPQQPQHKYQQQYQPPSYNQFSSAQQLPTNQFQSNPFPQFHTQNNLNQPSKTNNNSQSVIRSKNDMKELAQNEKWRESADLQNRVKNAIEKSLNVIKKFKAIKDQSMT